MVKILVDAGADKEARTAQGSTPLSMMAAQEGHSEVLTILLDAGANTDAVLPSTCKRKYNKRMPGLQ